MKLRWSFLHRHRDRCVPSTRVTLVMKSRHRVRTTLETPRSKHQSEDERTKSPTMPINEMETVVASTREHGRRGGKKKKKTNASPRVWHNDIVGGGRSKRDLEPDPPDPTRATTMTATTTTTRNARRFRYRARIDTLIDVMRVIEFSNHSF